MGWERDYCADCGAVLPIASRSHRHTLGRHVVGIGDRKRVICAACFTRTPAMPTHYGARIGTQRGNLIVIDNS